ncbi:hypothetical protein OIA45_19670 [Streptomyces chartreusis]|nr:hypothetical protein OIA45_19670 [Streptomyces chartreusis]
MAEPACILTADAPGMGWPRLPGQQRGKGGPQATQAYAVRHYG